MQFVDRERMETGLDIYETTLRTRIGLYVNL